MGMSKLFTPLSAIVLSGLLIGWAEIARAGAELPILKIDFSGEIGDVKRRSATFVVPDLNPAVVTAYGSSLTRRDAHLAKMIEVTAFRWCRYPIFEGVHWTYQAESGNRFMGQYYISCETAQKAVQTYGLGQLERTYLYYWGKNRQVAQIPVLLLDDSTIPRFRSFVRALRPECAGSLCPNEVIRERY